MMNTKHKTSWNVMTTTYFRQVLVLERIKYCILNGSKISSSWSVHRNFIVAQIGRNCRCTVSRKSKSICAKQNKMTNTAIIILEHWKENWLLKIAITLEGIAEHLGGLPEGSVHHGEISLCLDQIIYLTSVGYNRCQFCLKRGTYCESDKLRVTVLLRV